MTIVIDLICKLYFNSRLHETLYVEKSEPGKMHRKKVKSHTSLIHEPQSSFFSKITHKSGKGRNTANATDYFNTKNVRKENLKSPP